MIVMPEDHMPGYVPTVAEIETALKQLHDPEALRSSPLATLDLVHERVAPTRRATDNTTVPLPWIYGYELAALLRERIDNLLQATEAAPEQLVNQRPASRPQLYAQILRLRFVESRSWNEVAAAVGLAAGHIQNKLKRPALQQLLGALLEQRDPPTPAEPDSSIGVRPVPLSYLTNLPPPGEFIGRHSEVDQLLAKLRRRRMPIIEISGIGGVGKSALAKHVGWRALEEGLFDAAIWLSAKQDHLAIPGLRSSGTREALRSLNDLFETMARVLGAGHPPIEPDARRRLALDILTSGRFPHGVLVIVDNYETLRPDEQERIASFLFEELPYPCQALITSRHEELLVAIYAHVLPIKIHLERMSTEDAAACLDYFLSLQTPPIVTSPAIKEQIITVADHIPLAMLWLLGQLRSSPRAQAQTLAELREQRGGPSAILGYIFDHSYALLDDQPDAQSVLHALIAFNEPVTFAPLVATAALPPSTVERALLLLQQLSLIIREEGDEPRYDLVELARSYLHSRLDTTERQTLLHRATTYYADLGRPADRLNILPLLEWALESEHHELALALFDILTKAQFAESDTQVRDCATYGADIVQAARALHLEQRADWYEIFAICWPQIVRGELTTGQSALLRLLERAQQQGWKDNIALACSTLGLLFNDLGEAAAAAGHDAISLYETAASYLRQAAALWEDGQRNDWLAIVMGRLGTVARQLGDYDRALDYYTWTEALYDTLGNDAGRASALGRRGYTLSRRYLARGEGDPQEIERLLLEALRLSEQLGNRWSTAANSLRYAEFLEILNEPARALTYAEHARMLFGMIPDPSRAQQASILLARLQARERQRET
jgi:tetratricopeptide (TPR) repeat protein